MIQDPTSAVFIEWADKLGEMTPDKAVKFRFHYGASKLGESDDGKREGRKGHEGHGDESVSSNEIRWVQIEGLSAKVMGLGQDLDT